MNNHPILFIDSGIGGLPYCMDFLNRNPQETVCYLADNKNYPYGQRTKKEIISILISMIENLLAKKLIQPKIIVLACNTATVAALAELRQKFPAIPFVGTVPAIKPAAEAAVAADKKDSIANCRKIGVLGTARTIEELGNLSLAEKSFEITGIAAPELVDFIEHQYDDSNEQEKTAAVKKYIDIFRKENVSTLVLGCTHFLFLQEEFRREAGSHFKVFDSIEGISKRIEFLLNENNGNLRACNDACPTAESSGSVSKNKLFLTGKENANPFWEKRAQNLQFILEIINI